VIHLHCVGISDIPEDDWYCSSRTLKSKATGGKSATDSSVEKEDIESSAKPPMPTSWSNQTAASNETLVVSGVEKDDHKTSADSPKPPWVSNPVAASDEMLAALNKLKSL
jgi:hypothetical protein